MSSCVLSASTPTELRIFSMVAASIAPPEKSCLKKKEKVKSLKYYRRGLREELLQRNAFLSLVVFRTRNGSQQDI